MIIESRIKNFEKLGLGMFVHFGLYSMLESGEWTLALHKLDKAEYEKLPNIFTAKNFDADKLVLAAKNAGCKYITLTTRHHDGFSLYDTCGLSDYDCAHSACGRDLVREFVDACNKHGIMPMLYHTTIDWHNDLYNSKNDDTFEQYLQYLQSSIEILCKNYGTIGGFWFDGNWEKPNSDWKESELYLAIRKYQPQAMIINNTGLNRLGELGNIELDSVTFERGKPSKINLDGAKKYLASEMCQIINSHWGYAKNDINFKSMKNIIEELVFCRKCGSNYLLNIGPCGDGSINGYDNEILKALGKWTDIYGESIYDIKPTDIESDTGDYVVRGENCDYLFVTGLTVIGDNNVTSARLNAKKVVLKGYSKPIKSIEWIDNKEELLFEISNEKTVIKKAVAETVIFATNFFYGTDLVVRVAKIKF